MLSVLVNFPTIKNVISARHFLSGLLMGIYRFKMRIYFLMVVFGVLMAATVSADTGQEYFDRGIKTSVSGDHAAALNYFKKARRAGLNTAALNYNLAVSYYKLQQYENARKLFSTLSDAPAFEQRAYFNLGLIANKQKDEAAAIRWFQRAYRHRSSDKIRKLAAAALQRLGASARKTRQSVSSWMGLVSSALAYDTNVALANEDLTGVASESDTAVSLSVTAGRWLKGNMNSGVRVRLSASMQEYSTFSQYDDSRLSVRILRYDRLGDWKVRLGGSWDETYFGGSEYQRVVSADVRGRKNLSSAHQLRLRYKLSRIQTTDAVFDYLDGWRQQFRVGLQQRHELGKRRYYYQLELNDRKDGMGTVDPFTSYSPTRHTLRVTDWRTLVNQWRLRLDARFRYSDYNDDNVLSGNITKHRQDNQLRLSARISQEFERHWGVHGQYTLTTNDSTLSRKSYDRSVIKAGVSWSF